MGADDKKMFEEGEEKINEEAKNPAGRGLCGPNSVLIRVEVDRDVPMAVALPIELQADPTHQRFPFLDTTLADLGIQEWVLKVHLKGFYKKQKKKSKKLVQIRSEGEDCVGRHHKDASEEQSREAKGEGGHHFGGL